MISQKLHVLSAVLYLMTAVTGGQAQCQAGEVLVVTDVTCDGGNFENCLGDGGSETPGTAISIEPISVSVADDACNYGITPSGQVEAFSNLRGICVAKVRSCVADQTGGGGNEGENNAVCQAGEREVMTPATCVIDPDELFGLCLGEGNSELPGTIRSFEPIIADNNTCYYQVVSPTQLVSSADDKLLCAVNVTSCVIDVTGGTSGSSNSSDDEDDDEDDVDDDDDSSESR
ncbi:uncharacterized protein LOC135464953 [Liolophura sinensis]|uniref:uncharacterized protein LOC135464953 n=1 Tax=Liolophura sinensis TaxID=3198878 RepID=UPI00315990C1